MKIIKTFYTNIQPKYLLKTTKENIVKVLGFNSYTNQWSFTTKEGEDCVIKVTNNKIRWGGSKEVINQLFYDKYK